MSAAVLRLGLMALAALPLGGCVAASVEAASAGFGEVVDAGLAESRSGSVARTFTAPFDQVRAAMVAALERMALEYRRGETTAYGEKLVARAGNHDVDIRLTRLSPNATRLHVLADAPGIFAKDAATGHEIVHQTSQALDTALAAASRSRGTPRRGAAK